MHSIAPPSYPTEVTSSPSAAVTETNMDDLTFHNSSDMDNDGAEDGCDEKEDDGHEDGDKHGNAPVVSRFVFSLGTHTKLPQHTSLHEGPPSVPGLDDTMGLDVKNGFSDPTKVQIGWD